MKPFFADTMLVTLSFEEACNLRTAVANHRDNYSEVDESGNRIFQDVYDKFDTLYNELTKIIEMMPF